MRGVWLAIGLLALGCGLAGVVLPLVPTTPFLLVAAFAFARSSDRLHDWLVTHPRYGSPIRDWRAHGAIGRRAKRLAAVAMLATFSLSVAMGLSRTMLVVQGAILAVVALFVLSRPSPP